MLNQVLGLSLSIALVTLQSQVRADDRPSDWKDIEFSGKALIVLSDADMQATAYNHGILNLLEGVEDTLSVISFPAVGEPPEVATLPVSNSVIAWPQVVAISPDGQTAYVVETRGQPNDDVTRMQSVTVDMPVGNKLTVIDIGDVKKPVVKDTRLVGVNPTSVTISPDGNWLAISSGEHAQHLQLINVGTENYGQIVTLPLAVAGGRIYSLQWHPNNSVIALTINNSQVGFFRLQETDGGFDLSPVGAPVDAGKWITAGEFTNDGAYFLITDVNWGPEPQDYVLNPPGALVAIRFDDAGDHEVTSRATVGLGPEGFAMNNDATLLVAVNMHRTYLPLRVEGLPQPPEGVNHSSLSLVQFDQGTGTLSTLDHYSFDGLLPESAVFDADGDTLAVTVFHERHDPQQHGIVEFWRVEYSERPRLIRTNARVQVTRGPQDIEIIATPVAK